MSDKMQELIGKEIKQVFVDAERQHWIRFVTNDGTFDYRVEGDCCSESWIWGVSGLWYFNCDGARTYTQKVTEIREVELPPWIQKQIAKDGLCRQDEDAVYSYCICAEYGGSIELEFRNSSNGYYGGEIVGPETAPETMKWVEVPNTHGDCFIADGKPID
jgi:hypothetical protein